MFSPAPVPRRQHSNGQGGYFGADSANFRKAAVSRNWSPSPHIGRSSTRSRPRRLPRHRDSLVQNSRGRACRKAVCRRSPHKSPSSARASSGAAGRARKVRQSRTEVTSSAAAEPPRSMQHTGQGRVGVRYRLVRNLCLSGSAHRQPLLEISRCEAHQGGGWTRTKLGRSFAVKLWPTLAFLHNGVVIRRLVRPSDAELEEAFAALHSAQH